LAWFLFSAWLRAGVTSVTSFGRNLKFLVWSAIFPILLSYFGWTSWLYWVSYNIRVRCGAERPFAQRGVQASVGEWRSTLCTKERSISSAGELFRTQACLALSNSTYHRVGVRGFGRLLVSSLPLSCSVVHSLTAIHWFGLLLYTSSVAVLHGSWETRLFCAFCLPVRGR
jgi:hypothetical protein